MIISTGMQDYPWSSVVWLCRRLRNFSEPEKNYNYRLQPSISEPVRGKTSRKQLRHPKQYIHQEMAWIRTLKAHERLEWSKWSELQLASIDQCYRKGDNELLLHRGFT